MWKWRLGSKIVPISLGDREQAKWQKLFHIIIIITETDSKCRLCEQFDETLEHVISACPILTKEQYIKRHD